MANNNLTSAKKAKNDEFYTQYPDIQKEIGAYLMYNPDTFRNKVVYCNCDDPFESNFFKYFVLNFKRLGLKKLAYCTDTVVLQFWNIEFNSWTEKFQAEAIAPVLNKVGAFTANPVIRNIIGQPKSTFNIRQMMDEGKILIVNLSKGLIGEDNASILGAFMVTKIQLAAMSRSDIPNVEDRRPFYLYVDEFQNFATDSFATILSEARKYGLNLTVANQYISQMSDTVRNAVFGNVGTMISFRVSADDAPILAKQFEPQFEPNDLLQMHNRHFIINMVINGEKAPAFSATTLTLPPAQADNTSYIIENTRRNYSRTRAEIEREISDAIQPPVKLQPKPATPAVQPAPAAPVQQAAPITVPSEATPVEPVAPTPLPAADGSAEQPPLVEGEVKKKRKRRRKRKSSSGEASDTSAAEAPSQPATKAKEGEIMLPPVAPSAEHKATSDETEIKLR